MSHEVPAVKYDILSPAFFADPYPTLHRMQAEDPVYRHPLLHAWVLTRYVDIQGVLRDNTGRFSNRKAEQYGMGAPDSVQDKLTVFNESISRWVGFTDPPEHTRLRAFISRAFTVQAVERLRPRIQAVIDDLLAKARARGQFDMVADFAAPLPLIVFGELMGIPPEDTGKLKEFAAGVMPLLGAGLATAEIVEGGYRGVVGYHDYFSAHIAQRRGNSAEDLLSQLIAARVDGGGMTDDELVAMSAILFIASHETTTHLIANAIYTLLRQPEAARQLREDPRRIDATLEEMMRWDGPTFATFRRVVVDLEPIDGVQISAGDYILNVICAANRDPARFPDPDRFDIERPDNRHLNFSNGIHTCPGAALSRLEGRLAVESLVRMFSDIRLATDSVEWVPNMMIRGVRSLPVTLTPA